jgi:hypothetical protein
MDRHDQTGSGGMIVRGAASQHLIVAALTLEGVGYFRRGKHRDRW